MMKNTVIFSILAVIMTVIYLLAFGSISKPVTFSSSEYHLKSRATKDYYTEGVVLPKYSDLTFEMDVVLDEIDDEYIKPESRVEVLLTESENPYHTAKIVKFHPLSGVPQDGVYHFSFTIERRYQTILYTGSDDGEPCEELRANAPSSGKLHLFIGGYRAIISRLAVESRHIAVISNLVFPQIVLSVTLLLWILTAVFFMLESFEKYDLRSQTTGLFWIAPIAVSLVVIVIQLSQLFTKRLADYINDVFLAKTHFLGSAESSGEINKWIMGIAVCVFVLSSVIWLIKNRGLGVKKLLLFWLLFSVAFALVFVCSVMLLLIVFSPLISLLIAAFGSVAFWSFIVQGGIGLFTSLMSTDGYIAKKKEKKK